MRRSVSVELSFLRVSESSVFIRLRVIAFNFFFFFSIYLTAKSFSSEH